MLPTGRADPATTKATCRLCVASKVRTNRWLLLPKGVDATVFVDQEVDGRDQLVPLLDSTSYKQLKPEINELVRSHNCSFDMGGCAEVHTFNVPILWPSKPQSSASSPDALAEHNYWRNPKWLTRDRADQVRLIRRACMKSVKMQTLFDKKGSADVQRCMRQARCVSQIDPYQSLNHMHIHALAGKRRWIDNYGKIMWATIKMEPNLYKELALPGEKFDGYGAAIELGDLEHALRTGIEIRVNETIMDRARNVLRVMEHLMKDHASLKKQPLSEEAREKAELATEQAYQLAKASLLKHLREGHGVSTPRSSSPAISEKRSLSMTRPTMQARSSSIRSTSSVTSLRRSSRSNASTSSASRHSRSSSVSSVSTRGESADGRKA